MLKIMLVEDEPAILNGIHSTILNCGYPTEIIAEAYNGKAALVKLESCRPDVIISDIRMPVMDGLGLINEVNRLYPEIICVFLSGYSDFEYARQALRLKVFDYILKPVTLDALGILLEKIGQNVQMNNEKRDKRILDYLLSGAQITDSIEQEISLRFDWYYSIIVCSGSFSKSFFDLIRQEDKLWNESSIMGCLKELICDDCNCWVLSGKAYNEKILVVGMNKDDLSNLKNICKKIMNGLAITNLPINIAIGKQMKSLNELPANVNDLRLFLGKNIIIGKPRILIHETEENKNDYIALEQKDEHLISVLAEKGNFASLNKELQRIIENWEKKELPQFICEHSLKHIAKIVFNSKNKSSREHLWQDLLFEIDNAVSSAKTFSELYEAMIHLLKNMVFEIKSEDSNNTNIKEIIDYIENYIKSNFTKPISYEKLSEKFGYNSIYISSAFSRTKGISPKKLIIKLRIEKAKELLESQPDLLLKDIAAMVGYDDSLYFSKIFKEQTGLSPTEFRQQSVL